MTGGNIWKQILVFSIPLMLGNLLQQLYNTADSIIVGNFVGSNALAAVGSSSSLINLLITFSQGASVGAGVVIAQHIGAKNKKETQDSVHTALALALILGLLLTVGGVAASRSLLLWMNTPEEVLKESDVYLKLYFGGVVFNVIYNMASGILNAAGNSKRSLRYLGCASMTNIVLDLFFVAVLRMGVAGAAVATDISQLLSGILAIRFLMHTQEIYHVELKKIRLKKKNAATIISMGLPVGIQNMVISFSNVLVQANINGFGAAAMAGVGACMKIDVFNMVPITSLSMAITTFTGQNCGAGKIKRIWKGMRVTLLMVVLYTAISGGILFASAGFMIRLFGTDPEMIAYGEEAMRHLCPFYFLLGILYTLAGVVRGAGKTVPPMLILIASMCIFRIFWVNCILPLFGSITGIYLLYPASWGVGLILMVLYVWKGKWMPAELRKS